MTAPTGAHLSRSTIHVLQAEFCTKCNAMPDRGICLLLKKNSPNDGLAGAVFPERGPGPLSRSLW